jgi:hypothetical protein
MHLVDGASARGGRSGSSAARRCTRVSATPVLQAAARLVALLRPRRTRMAQARFAAPVPVAP